MATWVSSLDISQLQTISDLVAKQKQAKTGHISTIVNPLMEFVKESVALKVWDNQKLKIL